MASSVAADAARVGVMRFPLSLSRFVLVRCGCSRLRTVHASLIFCPLLRACWLLFVLFLACLCYLVVFGCRAWARRVVA